MVKLKIINGGAISRSQWRQKRLGIEAEKINSSYKEKSLVLYLLKNKYFFRFIIFILKFLGLYKRGLRNAKEVVLNQIELVFESLPSEFDGFSILHLSDLHIDFLPENLDRAIGLIKNINVDLCVLTGDYQEHIPNRSELVFSGLDALLSNIKSEYGVVAILGNHDSADLVNYLENRGAKCLVNETCEVQKGSSSIFLTGLDDVHAFYSKEADDALALSPKGFKIALVHTPERAEMAADNSFNLYLTGHTHGGQVALPNGRVILANLKCNQNYSTGLWKCRDLIGYTNSGMGVSGLPIRFNTKSEVVLINLKKVT